MSRVIITGTSRGIGFELVRQFAGSGHEVLALSRNDTPVKGLKMDGVSAWPFDITDPQQVEEVARWVDQHWGSVDILIHNAGLLLNKPFSETTVPDFRTVYEVNVFGVAGLSRALVPFDDARSSGNVHLVARC